MEELQRLRFEQNSTLFKNACFQRSAHLLPSHGANQGGDCLASVFIIVVRSSFQENVLLPSPGTMAGSNCVR